MDPIALRGLYAAFTNSLLTAAGSETVHDTTVLLTYCLNGKLYAKSGTNIDQATPTLDYATGDLFPTLSANKGTVMVWAYTSGGAVKCIQGDITDLVDGSFVVAPEFPANIPDDVTPFAYQILKAGATAGVVTFGTSDWDATGFTNVIVNIANLPNRPQVA